MGTQRRKWDSDGVACNWLLGHRLTRPNRTPMAPSSVRAVVSQRTFFTPVCPPPMSPPPPQFWHWVELMRTIQNRILESQTLQAKYVGKWTDSCKLLLCQIPRLMDATGPALALGTAKDARARGRGRRRTFFSRGFAVCRVISENFSSFVRRSRSCLPPSPARSLAFSAGGAAGPPRLPPHGRK